MNIFTGTRVWTAMAVATVALAAGCGSSSGSGATGGAGSAPVVRSAHNAALGTTVLVDSRGMTLYSLSAERNGRFICTTSACVSLWKPLTVPAGMKPTGANSLATVRRPDGKRQVAFKGAPLYRFVQDVKPGDAKGNGFRDVGVWRPVAVAGGTAATPAPAPAPSRSSYGY